MIQPGGAFIAGTLCGIVSTIGYRVIQVEILCFLLLRMKEVITLRPKKFYEMPP